MIRQTLKSLRFFHFPNGLSISVLLPLILCLFPLIVLHWENHEARTNLTRETDKKAAMALHPLAEKMHRQVKHEYWPGLFLRRFKARAEKLLSTCSDTLLEKKAPALVRASGYRNISPTLVWLGYFPGGDVRKAPRMCSGKGLSTANRVLFGGILHQIAKRLEGLPNNLENTSMAGRVAGLLGYGITPAYFFEDFRGRPFPVIYDRKFHYCVWDTIAAGDKVVGIVLVLMDMEIGNDDPGVKTLMANWSQNGVYPAFLPLPVEFGKTRGSDILHPRLPKEETRFIRDAVRAGMQIMQPDPATDLVGRVKLPFSQIGVVKKTGPWRHMLVNLGAESRFLGMLLCRVPDKSKTLAEKLALAWVAICIFFFGGATVHFKIFGNLPNIGVRDRLILWFVLLIAVPVALGASASFSLLKDRERNLEEYLRRRISTILGGLETGIGRIIPQQEKDLRDLFQDARFLADLEEIRLHNGDPEKLFAETRDRLKKIGIKPHSLVVFGPGSYVEKWDGVSLPPSSRKVLYSVLADTWYSRRYKDFEGASDSKIASEADFTQNSAATLLKALGVTGSAPITLDSKPDQVERLWLGSRQFMAYNSLLWRNQRIAYSIGIFWDNDFSISSHLKRSIPSLHFPTAAFDVAVFKINSGGIDLVEGKGNISGLKAVGHKAQESPVSRIEDFFGQSTLTVAYPSKRLPNYIMVGRASMEEIFRETDNLSRFLLILAGACLTLVVLTILVLSQSLAQPIVKMSNGLKAISNGDLSVTVSESRSDELGTASRILDQMTASLRERRRLTRFVSPQVMEVVGQGNLQRVIAGHKENLTILVSDIRNFTTLSETHSPEAVFTSLNRHLSSMSRAIRQHGGFIDRFVGDAVIAAFYQGSGPHHAVRAVRAAASMMEAHENLMKNESAPGFFPYQMGIGIDTGEVVTGLTGTEEVRLDLTALGDPLTRAHELETLSKKGTRTRIVVSNKIRDFASAEFRFQPLDQDWELDFIAPNAGHEAPIAEIGKSSSSVDPKSPSKSDESGIPGFSTEARTLGEKPKTFFMPFALALGLWLLPLVIVFPGLKNLETADARRNLEKTRQLLQDDRVFLEKALNPSFGLEAFLHGSIDKALEKAQADPGNLNTFLQAVKKEFENPGPRLPKVAWNFAQIAPPPRLASLAFSDLTLEIDSSAGQASFSRGPPVWTGTTLGDPPYPGSHSFSMGQGRIRASGLDLWGHYEAGYFLHTSFAGNGAITVHFDSLSGSRHGKAGLMVRKDLASASPNLAVSNQVNGRDWISYRLETASRTYGGGLTSGSNWLRLNRQGEKNWVSLSKNGRDWEKHGPYVLDLGKSPLVGVHFIPRIDPRIAADYGVSIAGVSTLPLFSEPRLIKELAHGAFGAMMSRNHTNSKTSEDLYRLLVTVFPEWDRLSKNKHWKMFQDSLGRAREIEGPEGRTLFFWLPIWKKDLIFPNRCLGDGIRQRAARELGKPGNPDTNMNFFHELAGILLTRIDPDRNGSPPQCFEILRRDYERRGGIMAIRGLSSPAPPIVSSRGAENLLANLPNPLGEEEEYRISNNLVCSVIPRQTTDLEIVFGRPIKETKDVGRLRFWGRGVWLGWLGSGIVFFLMVFGFGRIPEPSLKLQLGGVFLTAILPILLLVFLIITQAQIENEARLESDQLATLDKLGQSIDDGFQICQAFSRSLLQHFSRKEESATALRKIPFDTENFVEKSTGVLENLHSQATRHGFLIHDVILISTAMKFTRFPVTQSRGQGEILNKVLAFITFSVGKQLVKDQAELLGASSPPKGPDVIRFGTMFEEFQRTLFLLLGGESVVRLIQAPAYYGNMVMGAKSNEYFFRTLVNIDGIPRYDLQFAWRTPNLEQHLFDSWDLLNDPLKNPGPLRVAFSEKTIPGQFLTPPFLAFRSYNQDRDAEYSSQGISSRLSPYASLAVTSQEPLRIFSGAEGREKVVRFFPGVLLDFWLITGEVDLARLFDPIREATRQKRLILLAIVLLCALLAARVADRFLSPVSNLCQAADLITRGDYRSRMNQDFPGEFGILATAFNKMAVEAQEGKLLGQFVSESARMVARQSEGRDLSAKGQRQYVVVLFSALGGFKEALYRQDPVELIEGLNRYLQAMSPILNRHGGEIDKFIGDKILAVFRTSGNQDDQDPANRALTCALAMRRAMKDVHINFPIQLGVGLVAGPVLAGVLGADDVRLEFTVIGDTVNLASRLADLALTSPNGGIILDHRCAGTVLATPESAGLLRSIGAVTVKGKTRETPVFSVVETK